MPLHKIEEFFTHQLSVFPNITSKLSPPYSTAPPKKIMVQIKLMGVEGAVRGLEGIQLFIL
jgi:hypothetical protein